MNINEFSPFAQAYFITIVGIIGLCVGSFLNVVALRLLIEESIVFPGSKCPKCKHPLAWYDNIPVLSYLMLAGKCRYCKSRISVQYPLVELATGILFVTIFLCFGITLKTLFLLILASCLVVITVTDLREKLIFDVTSIPLIPLGLIYNFFDIGKTGHGIAHIPLEGINYTLILNEIFISAVIGAIVGALFFEVFSRLGLLFVGEYAFGSGDSIIAAALGAWFGWKLVLVIIALSFIFQLIVGIPIILYNMYKDKDFKSIVFLGLLLFSIFIPIIGKKFGITDSFVGAILTTMIAFAFALSGIFVVLQRAKERQSFTFIPFGPALVFGGFMVMFFGQKLLKYSLTIIH